MDQLLADDETALGLVQQAARDLGFDPRGAFVIGDQASDILLGRRLGAVTILVTTGYGRQTLADPQVRPDLVADTLAEAARLIEHRLAADHGPESPAAEPSPAHRPAGSRE